MKNARQARAWVYHDLTARSLRKMADRPQTIQKVHGGELTAAQVKRAQAEMLRLADWLDGKAAKLQPRDAPATP